MTRSPPRPHGRPHATGASRSRVRDDPESAALAVAALTAALRHPLPRTRRLARCAEPLLVPVASAIWLYVLLLFTTGA